MIHIENKVDLPADKISIKPCDLFDNLKNPDMNNIEAIDWQVYNSTMDQDGVIERWSQEFPRISTEYRTKADSKKAPWGVKSTPQYFDSWQESTLTVVKSYEKETTLGENTFETGIWYYTGIPMSDHQDNCGIENNFRV